MIPFTELSRPGQAWMASLFALLLVGTLALFLIVLRRTRSPRHLAVPFGSLLIAAYFAMAYDMLVFLRPEEMPWFMRAANSVPSALSLLVFALVVAVSVWAERDLSRVMRNTVSGASVRESTDNLPAGLCFATAEGLPLLVNRTMEDLCQRITGDGLLNANRFWEALTAEKAPEGTAFVWIEGATALKLPDERVWVFARQTIRVDGAPVEQITASDATDLWALSRRLEEENWQLADMNRRLSHYGDSVTELTRDEEILSAKVRIHDELGQTLLSTKIALAALRSAEKRGDKAPPPDGIPVAPPEELFEKWKRCVGLLRHGAAPVAPDVRDPVRQIEEAGAAVGIAVEFRGRMPMERRAARLIFSASREAITNAVRHAGADTLTISVSERDVGWDAVFTNSGRQPTGPIAEGGGLGGLRRGVEAAGGTMRVEAEPAFRLTLCVPKSALPDGFPESAPEEPDKKET